MVDVPCLDHLWGRSEGLTRCWTRLGASMKKHQEKLLFWKARYKGGVTEFQPKKPCLTPTLMDERQAKEPWKHAFPGTPGMHTMELMVHNQKYTSSTTIVEFGAYHP